MQSIMISSTQINNRPMLMPDFRGMACSGNGLPASEAKAVRELA